MKILLLADQAEPTLWEHLDKRKLEGVELVLSCGEPARQLPVLSHLLHLRADPLYPRQPRRPI